MLLGGFSLELLVDGKLLKEYNESVDKRTTTTGVSYVLDQKSGEKVESDQTYYAAVDQLDKNYEILFGAKKELFTMGEQSSAISFRARIYVDGQLDRSLRLINKAVKIKKDGFIGEKRKKAALMFDLSKWMENDDESIEEGETQNNVSANNIKNDNDDNLSNEKKPDQNKFGYGAVSVYFFNAKDFDKNETATGNPIPLAALHLHYRPTQWLLARDILAKEESNDIFDEAQIIKEVDDTQNVQQVKPHPVHSGNNKDMNQETDDDDCGISEWTGKLDLGDAQVIEENRGAKKKSRGRKEKKNVEKVKNEMEESADNDCDKGNDDVQEVDEENQGAKKKSRGRKEKKNVEKVKNEMEESADNDCEGKDDVQEVDEENQEVKKKSRGKKEKKNVEKVEKSSDNDCDISELAEKLTLDDAQQTVGEKKKSRDKKKTNVENVIVNRYNLRPRK